MSHGDSVKAYRMVGASSPYGQHTRGVAHLRAYG